MCLQGTVFGLTVYAGTNPPKLQVSQRQGDTAAPQFSLGRVVPRKRPQPRSPGALLLAESLLRARAQWLQVQVDAILGAQDQLQGLDGWPQEVGGKLKAEQAEGRDHLHLIHGKLLPNAVPAVSGNTKRHQAMGCLE